MERRKTKRRLLLYYGRVYDERAQKQFGFLVDITERGFMLLSDEPFAIGETHNFRLEITSDIDQQHSYLNFAAKSVWCEADIAPNKYNTGFEIVELKAEDIAIIQNIIKTYGFRDS
jgi:hypothetical protein